MASGNKTCAAGGGAVYAVGWFGAVIYLVQTATGFWDGVWGVIQSFFWPGFLVYELMKFLEI